VLARLELDPVLAVPEVEGVLVLPEDVLLRGAGLAEPDFEDEELFVDVFAVVDDFGVCEGSSSP